MADDDTKKKIREMAESAGMDLADISKVIKDIEQGGEAAVQAWKKLSQEINNSSAAAGASSREQLEFERRRLEFLEEIKNKQIESGELTKEQADLLQKDIDKQKEKLETIEEIVEKEEKITEEKKKQVPLSAKIAAGMAAAGAAAMALRAGLKKAGAAFTTFSTPFMSVFNWMLDKFHEFDTATKQMQKGLGTREMNRELLQARGAAYAAGMSVSEYSTAIVTLHDEYTGFSQQSKEVRGELAKTTALMANLGFDASATAAGINLATRAMGQTPEQASKMLRGVRQFGKEVGLSPKRMSAMFKSNLGALSNYGRNYTKVFKEMALATKNTGIEMDKLLGITEKFTTFEGATEAAANLNAMLGGNFVDSTALMTASLEDPQKAIQLLQDAMKKSGKNFNDMGPAAQRAIASAAGFDNVGEAAAAFNNELEKGSELLTDQATSNKDLQKEGAKNMTVREALERKLMSLVGKHMGAISRFFDMTFKLLDMVYKTFVTGEGILGSWGPALADAFFYFLPFVAIGTKIITILGPILKSIGVIAGLLFSWPALLLAAAGALLVYFKGWDGTVQMLKDGFSWLTGTLKGLLAWVQNANASGEGLSFANMPPDLKQKLDNAKQWLMGLWNDFKSLPWGTILTYAAIAIGGFIVLLRILNRAFSGVTSKAIKFGLSLLAVGAGIYLMFKGITDFLTVWSKLSGGDQFTGGFMIIAILVGIVGGILLLEKAKNVTGVMILLALVFATLGLAIYGASAAISGLLETMSLVDPTHILNVSGSMFSLALAVGALAIAGILMILGGAGIWIMTSALENLTDSGIIDGITKLGQVISKVFESMSKLSGPIDSIKNLMSTINSIDIGKIISFAKALWNPLGIGGDLGPALRDFFKAINESDTQWINRMKILTSFITNFPFATTEAVSKAIASLNQSFAKPISTTFVSSLTKVVEQLKRLDMDDIAKLNTLSVVGMDISEENAGMQKASKRRTDANIRVTIYMPVTLNGRVFNDAIEQISEAKVISGLNNAVAEMGKR